MRAIYTAAADATVAWAGAVGLQCPQGCGLCSRGIDPPVLPIEADYVAGRLLSIGDPHLIARALGPPEIPGACVFYRDDDPNHCTIYEIRPLLCRLFGFSGVSSREGGVRFALCSRMPVPATWTVRKRQFAPGELSPPPPVAEDYRRPLGALRPNDEGDEQPLSLLLRRAFEAAWLEESLRAAEEGTGSGLLRPPASVAGLPPHLTRSLESVPGLPDLLVPRGSAPLLGSPELEVPPGAPAEQLDPEDPEDPHLPDRPHLPAA